MGPVRRRRPAGLRTVPFVLAGLLALSLAVIGADQPAVALVALALGVLTAVAAVVLPWRRLPRWAPTVLTLLVMVDVALLLIASSGNSPAALSLVMLPILWLAAFGTRWQLRLLVASVPFVVLVPAVIDGEGLTDALRQAVLLTAVAAALGSVLHRLVVEVEHRRKAERRAHDRMVRILDTTGDTAVITWSWERVITAMNRGAEQLFGIPRVDAVGVLSPADVIGDEAVVALRREMGFGNPLDPDAEGDDLLMANRWATESRTVTGVAAEITTGPRPVSVRLDLSAVTDDMGWVSEYVLVAHDVSDLQRVQDELESAQRDLATVVEVLHEAQAGEDVRRTVCERTRALTGADAVFVLEPRDGDLVVTSQDGQDVGTLRAPLDGMTSAAALAFTNGRRVEVADTSSDPRASQELADRLSIRSVLYEPIRHEGRVVALLAVAWREPRDSLSDRVAESVWMLASETGLAMTREKDVRRLERHARIDALTGLPNRREWDQVLGRHVEPRSPADEPAAGDGQAAAAVGEGQAPAAAAPDQARPLCLAMLDVDHFKAYNDSLGHLAGDALLRDAAAAWRRTLRSGDVLARYGGEEFAVLLPECSVDHAVAVIERLRQATPGGVTVSAGLAQWDGAESPADLVGRADAALYRAKLTGRDRLVVADPLAA